MDETPARNGRTSVWHAEVADGPRPLPGAWLDQSKGRTGARRAQLQSQTRDCRAGRAGAAERVATSARLRRPVPNRPETGRHTSVAASSHTACYAGTTVASPVLRHHVDQRRAALLHLVDSARQRRPDVVVPLVQAFAVA